MSVVNLQWIQQEWRKWIKTDRSKKICPSGDYKLSVEHVAKLFAAHCLEALREETKGGSMAMLKRDLTQAEYTDAIKHQIREMELSATHVFSRKGKRDVEKRLEWLKKQLPNQEPA